jgi:hypothetical protein
MKTERLLIVLPAINLMMLIANVAQLYPISAQGAPAVLRGRALEIVDAQGRVRASLGVIPAGTPANGESSAETVLLRLITERGRPSVKVGASEETAGISLAGPTGTRNTWITLGASGTATSLRLKDENGREQVITP